MTNPIYSVGKGSLPQSSDVNQFANGLTGQLDIGQMSLAAPLANPTQTITTTSNGAGVLTGTYAWGYYDITGNEDSAGTVYVAGNTLISPISVSLTLSSGQAMLSMPMPASSLTKQRGIVRNLSSGSAVNGPWYLVTTISANTLTVYDNTPDSQLTQLAPTQNTTGTSIAGINTLSHAGALTALYNFNGTTSSTRGQRGQFSRASAANNPQTLANLPNDAPSYVWSKWGAEALALSVWEGTTNLVYNSDFETVTTTATLFSDPLTSGAAWTVQAGGFTYSASGATSGGDGYITSGNSAWKPLLGSNGSTSLPLTVQITATTPATLVTSSAFLWNGGVMLFQNATNYYLAFITNAGFTLGKIENSTFTSLATFNLTITASTTYTITLSLDHLGNLTAKFYSGAGTGGTLLQTLTANDTSLSGGFLLGVGGDTGVVVSNASMTGPWANGWVMGNDATPNGAYAITTDSGKYAVSVVKETNGITYLNTDLPVSSSTTYTVSYYAKIVTGSPTVGIRWVEENSSGTVLVDTNNTQVVTTTNGIYQRIVYTATTQSTTTNLLIRPEVSGNAGTIEIDAIQLEQKAYATPFLSNPSTTATATRAAETMTVPSSVLNPNEGTVTFEWIPYMSTSDVPSNNDAFNVLQYGNPGTDGMFIRYNNTGNLGNLQFEGIGGSSPPNYTGGWTVGESFAIAVSWQNGNASCYVNGTLVGSGVWTPPSNPVAVYVLWRNGYLQGNSSISNLAFFNRALTAQEVYSIYASTQPLVDALATPLSPAEQSLNSAVSSPDSNDNYTVATYRRRDNTIESVATLSGTPSPSGSSNYPTLTIQYYDRTGTVVTETVTYALTYDANDKITSKVIQ